MPLLQDAAQLLLEEYTPLVLDARVLDGLSLGTYLHARIPQLIEQPGPAVEPIGDVLVAERRIDLPPYCPGDVARRPLSRPSRDPDQSDEQVQVVTAGRYGRKCAARVQGRPENARRCISTKTGLASVSGWVLRASRPNTPWNAMGSMSPIGSLTSPPSSSSSSRMGENRRLSNEVRPGGGSPHHRVKLAHPQFFLLPTRE